MSTQKLWPLMLLALPGCHAVEQVAEHQQAVADAGAALQAAAPAVAAVNPTAGAVAMGLGLAAAGLVLILKAFKKQENPT